MNNPGCTRVSLQVQCISMTLGCTKVLLRCTCVSLGNTLIKRRMQKIQGHQDLWILGIFFYVTIAGDLQIGPNHFHICQGTWSQNKVKLIMFINIYGLLGTFSLWPLLVMMRKRKYPHGQLMVYQGVSRVYYYDNRVH